MQTLASRSKLKSKFYYRYTLRL